MNATIINAPSAKLGTTRTIAELNYVKPGCKLTLREGLAEYMAAIEGLLTYEELSPEARELFPRHDIAHVLFGCDTSIPQEAMVDIWTMFGSDVGLRTYMAYLRSDEAKSLFTEFGYGYIFVQSLKAVPAMYRAYRGARSMYKKWPWRDHEAYMDTPLDELRAQFGVEVVTTP